ncbi:general secretion pathway protein J [Marinobacter gudaonensis]|uniref:General secretion pathway protein J n=1 Tax=Marinobacter gudaonensis TaxID=375760 RepID=A0A1I6I0F8_9GAMM|nr:prepilin-type N-terminal cleavage/methylation domain-containing protein [Marinobacter gudaonensis]SFR59940.1 general secretion pathway protein J [Marinobacter gudaonensis]
MIAMTPTMRQQGFTILEILVGFTLLAVIIAMMFVGIRLVYRIDGKSEAHTSAISQIRTINTFLRHQLRGALPNIPVQQEGETGPLYFEGTSQRMRFVATMPPYLRQGGIFRQTLEVVGVGNEKSLVFRFEPINALTPDPNGLRQVTLLDKNIEDIHFRYGEWAERGRSPSWLESWETPRSMPGLIRIDLRFTDDANAFFWPSFVVSPVTQVN